MPIITTKLPQEMEPITIVTLKEVLEILPNKLDYPIDVWIGGKLARYGQTDGSILFLSDEEPTVELRSYFESLCKDVAPATIDNQWLDQRISAIRLYNKGKLIVDKETGVYTELPEPTRRMPIITVEDVVSKLPKEVPWKNTTYLVGGLVKNGWSGNDVDFTVDGADNYLYGEIREALLNNFGSLKVDVGNAPMPEREPIYKVKIYEGGKWQL